MSIFTCYKKAVIYPSAFILIFCISYSAVFLLKSDILTVKPVFFKLFLPALFYILIMCGLSLTIFLNKIEKLGGNIYWNLATWFFLPCVYFAIVFNYDIQNRITYDFGFGNDFLYLAVMTVPFVFGLYMTFKQYRRNLTSD